MRKNTALSLCFLGLAAAFFILWQRSARSQDRLPHFSIHVTQTAQRIEMKCQGGCAWQNLMFSCDGQVPCSAVVDERGVGGPPPAPRGK